jgi:hypothetical protein
MLLVNKQYNTLRSQRIANSYTIATAHDYMTSLLLLIGSFFQSFLCWVIDFKYRAVVKSKKGSRPGGDGNSSDGNVSAASLFTAPSSNPFAFSFSLTGTDLPPVAPEASMEVAPMKNPKQRHKTEYKALRKAMVDLRKDRLVLTHHIAYSTLLCGVCDE